MGTSVVADTGDTDGAVLGEFNVSPSESFESSGNVGSLLKTSSECSSIPNVESVPVVLPETICPGFSLSGI